MGWILSTLDQLNLNPQPAVAVLPLGTGNDLARTLNWGGVCVILLHYWTPFLFFCFMAISFSLRHFLALLIVIKCTLIFIYPEIRLQVFTYHISVYCFTIDPLYSPRDHQLLHHDDQISGTGHYIIQTNGAMLNLPISFALCRATQMNLCQRSCLM